MANNYASLTATQVGSYFAKQYYQMLQQQRDVVYQFYSKSSSMVRVDGDVIHSVSDLMNIHQLIISTNFTGIEIKTINSLESLSGSVLVVVSGSVKSRDFSGWRKFVQTFFLAPQEKGYFVQNDIFHFVDHPEVVHQTSTLVAKERDVEYQQSAAHSHFPVSNYPLENEAVNYISSVHIEDREPVQEYGYMENHHQQYEEDSEPENELETYEPDETSYEECPWSETMINMQEPQPAAEEPEKLTYASILRVKGNSCAPSTGESPASTWSMPPASTWSMPPATEKNHVSDPLVQQKPTPFPPSSNNGAVEDSFSLDEEGEYKSVYVRNLSPMVTAQDIAEEFKSFGKIKSDGGVFMKNRKDSGICYAFVEFEDLQSVKNAIQASPIQLCGRQVYIEERRPNSATAFFGGRHGGRGRGHGGGRSFGRGNDQNDPLRSNGLRGGYH